MKFNKLILKNILRNKRRTLLTLLSLVVSLFLMITLATILTELSRGSEHSNPSRLITRHSVSLVFPLPAAQQQKIAAIPGVKQVMPFSWFGGIYKDEKNFFANFAADASKLHEIHPELEMSADQWTAFINDRRGAMVGAKLVTLYGFAIGQTITLRSPIYNKEMEFIVRGICKGDDEKTLYFHHEYLNEMLPAWAKDNVGMFSILANSPADVARVGQAVDSGFINTDAPTKTESEREFAASFEAMAGGVKQFMYLIMGAITFSLLLVMANTMAMTVRERTKEVGTLKALGFQRGTIARLFVTEALLVAIIGGLIGTVGTMLIYKSFDVSIYIPNVQAFAPTMVTLATALAVSILVGLVSVTYSAYRVSGMTIAAALRSTE